VKDIITNLLAKEQRTKVKVKRLSLIEQCKVTWRTAVKDGVDVEPLLYLTDIIDRRYKDAIKST